MLSNLSSLRRRITTVIAGLVLAVTGAVWSPVGNTVEAACTALPTDKGTVTMTVAVPSTGTYRVWSRIFAQNTTDNSFLMQADQTYCNISVGGGSAIAPSTWTWVDYQNGSTSTKVTMDLTTGNHTFVLAGQDPSVMVDRVILTTDTSCTPTGTGDNCATLPATATLTGASDGQTLTGGVPVGATVANASGVTKVDFYIDNTLFNSDTISPYCMTGTGASCGNVDTTQISNGAHVLKVTVTYAGGTLNATANVTISNTNPTTKPGDVNHDNSVNIFDLSILLGKWSTTDANADLNHSGNVDVFDLSILLSHWGS